MKNKKICSALLSINIAFCAVVVSVGTAFSLPAPVSYAAVDLIDIAKDGEEGESSEGSTTYDDSTIGENTTGIGDIVTESTDDITWETIEIGDEQQLRSLVKSCTLDTWSQNKYVKLTNDIYLSGEEECYFATFGGIFDGNGYTIDGLVIRSNMSYLGFISKLQPCGTVRNLTVKGSITPGNKQVVAGGIVGDNYGTIDNCSFKGIVKGNDYTGGIAGYNESTGIINKCTSAGTVIGQHYTGGIAGSNYGGIYNSVNRAEINTINIDRSMSIEDINIDTYLNGIMIVSDDTSEGKTLNTANNSIDTGGIVGHSTGIVEYCTNTGNVGYERVGYNVGGIAGRQSGYIHGCQNSALIRGRKDVGGIVGQAEPNVELDLTEDIINKLTDNINELHDLVNKALEDSGNSSDQISDRIGVVQKYVDDALTDTSYLSSETIDFVNGVTYAGNEVLSRADYAVDEASKNNGALDKTRAAMDELGSASDDLSEAIENADVYGRMSDSDRARYDNDTATIKAASEEYQKYYNKVNGNNYYYYLYKDSKTTNLSKDYRGHEDDLEFYQVDVSGNEILYDMSTLTQDYKEQQLELKVYHAGKKAFPAEEGIQATYDAHLIADATSDAAVSSNNYADTRFKNVEGRKKPDGTDYPGGHVAYSMYIADYTNDILVIMEPYVKQSAEDTKDKLEDSITNLSNAADNLSSAASQSSDIVRNIANREDIVLPSLSDNYKNHTSNFVANIQGISENLSFLNAEMNNSSNIIIDDMAEVNDSFNKIMILFADAIDGALDGEYVERFEDESFEVANECIDGAVADCANSGNVEGELDVSGVAGTMGIEYDFDLEGDLTDRQDARVNTVFKTKCVLRGNKNEGRITAHKSYAGGITGNQEMGTILRGENYGRVASSTGDYVGGIAGNSISSIRNCYSRGIMSGDDYVGGIVGYGHEVYDCYAIPAITEADSFYGAIAGEVDDNSRLKNNYFVSDELAGIDRISYSQIAEPVSYEELLSDNEIPAELKELQVTFLVEGRVIGEKKVDYGKSLVESQYPDSITAEDYYIDWDYSIVHDMTTDMEVVGEHALYRTTIASSLLRGNNQSVLLVDGKFKEGQNLEVMQFAEDRNDAEYGKIIERLDVVVPFDGQDIHQFRYQPKENVKKAGIYIAYDGNYSKVDTRTMGMYQLFDVTGSNVSILIVDETSSVWIYVALGITVTIFLIAIVVILKKISAHKKNKKNRSHKRD